MVPAPGDVEQARLHGAARQLETIVLKQLINASKVFTGGNGPGSAVRADLFADALADAMVKGGGIGLARKIEESLAPGPRSGSSAPTPRVALSAPAAPTTTPSSAAAGSDLPSSLVTSPYGLRHDPFDGHLTRHEGVDLAGEEGATIRAAAGGVVTRSGARGGYGNAVEIDHGNGLSTVYAHTSALLVHEGDRVAPG